MMTQAPVLVLTWRDRLSTHVAVLSIAAIALLWAIAKVWP